MARRSAPFDAIARRVPNLGSGTLVRRIWIPAQRTFRQIAPKLPPWFVRFVLLTKARLLGVASSTRGASRDVLAAFDESHYRSQVRVPASFPAFDHYQQIGRWRGLSPNPLFDAQWYLDRYPEVAEAAVDPFVDYVDGGWRRGRDPSPWFSSEWYLAQVAALGQLPMCPLVHYSREGCARGLTTSEEHARRLQGEDRLEQPERSGVAFATLFDPDAEPQDVPMNALAATSHKLVTFDLWDTLVRRTRPADAAKVATARRMQRVLRKRDVSTWRLFEARVDAEWTTAASDEFEEYVHDAVLERVLLQFGFDDVQAKAVAAELAAREVADESANTARMVDVANAFAEVVEQPDKRVMVLSDFYMGGRDLLGLLQANEITIAGDDVLSSCEIGGSKRLGTAYRIAEQRADVEAREHLHIGDNRVVDIDNALAAGASAALVRRTAEEYPGPGALTRDWYVSVPSLIRSEAEAMLVPSVHAHADPIPVRLARKAGGAVAVLAVAHVAAAIEAAITRDVGVVHYLSREGAFLADVHRRVADILTDGQPPRAVHIEASRRSTFGPSLAGLDDESLARIARQYPRQSLQGLLVSLGVDPELVRDELARMPIAPSQPVDVAGSALVREFLERPAVSGAIELHRLEQRALLLRYLDARELGDRSVVVDVGWRGTIQDNLCLIRPETQIHGVYLGLFPYLNPQPANATKEAVAFDGNLDDAYAFADPPAVIESPMTPPIATTCGYAEVDGRVEPIRVEEAGRAERLITALQQSVLEVAPHVARRLVAFGASPDLLKPGMGEFVRSLYADPPHGLADIWFESAHDDTFGAANDTPYAKTRVGQDVLSRDVELSDLDLARSSRWPSGYAQWTPVWTLGVLRSLINEAPR